MALLVGIIAMLWHARRINVVALLVEYIGNISHITGAAANAVDKQDSFSCFLAMCLGKRAAFIAQAGLCCIVGNLLVDSRHRAIIILSLDICRA